MHIPPADHLKEKRFEVFAAGGEGVFVAHRGFVVRLLCDNVVLLKVRIFVAIFSGDSKNSLKDFLFKKSISRIISSVHLSPIKSSVLVIGHMERCSLFFIMGHFLIVCIA